VRVAPLLRFSEHMSGGEGEAMFRHACAMGLEGIVSKKLMSRYKSGAPAGVGSSEEPGL
jgi:ATP-dependent DNA ligase